MRTTWASNSLNETTSLKSLDPIWQLTNAHTNTNSKLWEVNGPFRVGHQWLVQQGVGMFCETPGSCPIGCGGYRWRFIRHTTCLTPFQNILELSRYCSRKSSRVGSETIDCWTLISTSLLWLCICDVKTCWLPRNLHKAKSCCQIRKWEQKPKVPWVFTKWTDNCIVFFWEDVKTSTVQLSDLWWTPMGVTKLSPSQLLLEHLLKSVAPTKWHSWLWLPALGMHMMWW